MSEQIELKKCPRCGIKSDTPCLVTKLRDKISYFHYCYNCKKPF